MWAERPNDQADGLRRMFSPERLRAIELVAGSRGAGRRTAALQLGIALARMGHETILIDAGVSADGAVPGHGWMQPASARAACERAPLACGPHGLKLLALQRAAGAAGVPAIEIGRHCAAAAFALLTDPGADCAAWLPIELQRRELVVVLSREPASITQGYATIKRLSASGAGRRFQVLINRAASAEEAALIFRNMARAARGYLDVELRLLGFVPPDPTLARAAREGRGVLDLPAGAPAAAAFTRLAHAVATRDEPLVAAEPAERRFARAANAA